jgi:hypothetical protein
MGHDIWNATPQGTNGPVNLGHLLPGGYLPMPGSRSHVFYCPSMEGSGGMKPGPYGFVYQSPVWPNPDAPRGFDGWGKQGRIVNIGYEYRVSLEETNGQGNAFRLKEIGPWGKLTQVGNMALFTDIISYGAGKYAHVFKYNFCKGDGSVQFFNDREDPPLWKSFGMSPAQNNDIVFLILDHPHDWKSYLKW